MNNLTLRDTFWSKVYDIAREDRDVIVVSADMGAPALDKFKRDLPSQYVDVGIAEQQAIAVSAGLALEGKKVFAYAIAPFITLRCYEHIRVSLSMMNLPVTLVGVGAGFSYNDSGPTHHMVEDISVLRILPKLEIDSITDNTMSASLAQMSCEMDHPNYIRLDRKAMPDVYSPGTDFSDGLAVLKESDDVYVVATGHMVHKALEAAEKLSEDSIEVGVIDLYRLPINQDKFLETLQGCTRIISMEEHTLPGGLGSAVCELLNDSGISIPVKRLALDFSDGYCYTYGSRENILSGYGLSSDTVAATVLQALETTQLKVK